MRSVAIVANPFKERAKKESVRLINWLARRNIRVLPPQQMSRAEVVFSLGGDGTVLSIAAQAARLGVPVLGINIGRLGFLTAGDCKDLNRVLDLWYQGKMEVSERMMLEVSARMFEKPLLALNDAVIRTGVTTRVTTVYASIENEELGRFLGDGLIVSTSTGSTAYSLSAQGPVVHPEVEALILTPICAHSFSQRPLVFPGNNTLCLQLYERRQGNDVQLTLDGQKTFKLKSGDKIFVGKSSHRLKLLQDPDLPYFRLLREKLSWGGN